MMKIKQLLTKMLLVAVGLCAGVNGAWAQTTLYERGTTGNDWSDSDLEDWVVDSDHGVTTKADESESTTNVTSSIDSNRLKFNSFGAKGYVDSSTNTAASPYSFTKTITTQDDTMLRLTADWAGGGATGTNSRTRHTFTFGDIIFTLYGSSGGAFLKIGSADAIEIIGQGSNVSTYRSSIWHIELTVNQSTNVVQYSLSTPEFNSGTAVTGNGTTASAGSFNSVVIALANDKLPNWSLAQTLNSIKITEEEVASTARGINVNFTYKVNGEGDAAEIPAAHLPEVTTYYDKEVDDVFTPTYPASFNTPDYAYTYTSGGDEYTVTEDEDQTITLLYNRTERTKVDVVVKGMYGKTELFSNTVTNIAEGESVVYGFPKYVLQAGVLYESSAPYAVSITASSTPIEVSYSLATVGEGEIPVYFSDFGGAAGTDWSQYSGGNVVAAASVVLVPASTLADGVYKIVIQNNRNRTAKVKVGDREIGTLATGANAGARVTSTFTDVTVLDGQAITAVAGGSTQTDNIDYILVYKTAELATIGSTGWTTFASPYPIDLSDLTASTGTVTAYYASAVGGDKATMTSTTQSGVAAGEGIMLKGTPTATITIPVASSGTALTGNMLKGCTTETAIANDATSGYNNYVLVNVDGKAVFQSLVDNGATIPAGKAYLQNGAYSSGARMLSIVFDDDMENTSVGENLWVEGDDFATAPIYNLKGQRVAKATKGLYVVKGKKLIVK